MSRDYDIVEYDEDYQSGNIIDGNGNLFGNDNLVGNSNVVGSNNYINNISDSYN
jgi:hypothetical protein